MRSKKWMLGGVAVVTVVVAVLTLLKKERPPEAETPPAAVAEKAAAARNSPVLPASEAKAAAVRVEKKIQRPSGPARVPGQVAVRQPAVAKVPEERSAAREKAVEAWENFVDEVAERTIKPTAEQALQFKEAFHKLDKADQMDAVQTALNLIPDEQFALMYPILFDKTENADVLDEIFSDALNRDEDIKVPMMKELYKDKEHPMYVESARILDATGELDEMNEKKEAKEE